MLSDISLKEGEKALTRDEFVQMVQQCKKNGRMWILDASEGNDDVS